MNGPDSADGDALADAAGLVQRLDRQDGWTVASLRLVEKYPGVNSAALARRAGTTPAEMNSRMRRLTDAGLVEREGGTGHRLTALGAALLSTSE